MNVFKNFVMSFSVGSIVFGCLYMLCPKGNMSKSVKYIFSLCFICCIVTAGAGISKIDFNYFEKIPNYEILTEKNASLTAQSVFEETLTQQDIIFKKITVDVNKTDTDGIVISRVTVYTNEPYEKIISLIGSDSYEVVVINE